jgi:alkylation response protein AidB-like acyl-CoA dehydrogenase
MDLSLSETQEMLRDSVRQLLAREMSWERVRESQSSGFGDEALWKTLSAAGWLTLAFPDALGGGGADLPDIAVATEEIAKSAAVVPFAETMSGTYAVVVTGTSLACEELAAGVRDSDAGVTAALDPDHAIVVDGLLSGTKRYVDYGPACAYHLVTATDDGQPNLYLVSARSPGVSQETLSNIGRTPQATVTYHQVPVVRAGGTETVARLTEVATILTCVQLLGYAQFAFDLTVGYVRDRFQFGRPLGTFQAVQHRCADMATMVEATRFLTYETVWKVHKGTATTYDLAVAKAAASRTAVFATMEGHQLHGGIGVTEEYPLQFFSRRVKERSLAWGSQHASVLEIARHVDDEEDWR